MAQNNWLDEGSTPVPKPTSAAADTSWLDEQSDVVQDNALVRGIKKSSQSIGIAKGLVTGDSADTARKVAEAADYARKNPGMQEGKEMGAAWDRGDGITGGIKEVAGEFAKDWREAPGVIKGLRATGRNLRALGERVVEQVPNMAAPVAGMIAGGAAGSAAAGPVGTVLGGWAGASLGNAAVEGGSMVQEALQKDKIDPTDQAAVSAYLDKNGDRILGQAGVKGAIIGAVDTATAGLGHFLLSGPGKAAASRALADMGVDAADKAAVRAAKSSAAFKNRIASDAAYQATQQGANKIARNAGAAALEPAGEFAGEFVGQGVATGEWDTKNAALEAASSIGQSGAMFAGQKAYQALTRPAGAADPNAPQTPPTAPPEAPDLTTAPGAGDPTTSPGAGGAPYQPAPSLTGTSGAELLQRQMDARNLDPLQAALRPVAGPSLTGLDGSDLLQAQMDAARQNPLLDAMRQDPARQLLDMPTPELDIKLGRTEVPIAGQLYAPGDTTNPLTGERISDQRPLSQQMGIDPTAGPLSKAAATAVDSGTSQHLQDAQFIGATGRDLQARATGPGVANESNVIDVQARVVEDRAIGTQRRLTTQESARESGATAFREGVPRSEIAAIPNVIHRAQQLRGYDDAAQKASSVPALPAPTNLREGLERIRAQKQEAANAQAAAPSAAPAAAPVPAAGTGAVEAAGVKPAGQRQLSADEQAAQDREEARAKELSLPPVLSARLQEAHKAHGRDVKRSVVERSIANEKANNTGTPKAKRERADRIARLEADLALFDEAAAMPPKEAAGPVATSPTTGVAREPTSPQAIQAGAQPAQAAAARAGQAAPVAAPNTGEAQAQTGIRRGSQSPTNQTPQESAKYDRWMQVIDSIEDGAVYTDPISGDTYTARVTEQGIDKRGKQRGKSVSLLDGNGVPAFNLASNGEAGKDAGYFGASIEGLNGPAWTLETKGNAERDGKAQPVGAQAAPAPGPQGAAQAAQAGVAPRPKNWRTSMLGATPVAKTMGIDTKGKRLAQVVAEIDAFDAAQAPGAQQQRDDFRAAKAEAELTRMTQADSVTQQAQAQSQGAADQSSQIAEAVSKADRLDLKGAERAQWVKDSLAGAWGMTADEVGDMPEVAAGLRKKPSKEDATAATVRRVEQVVRQAEQAVAIDRQAQAATENVAEQAAPKPDSTVTTMRSLAQQFRDRHAVTKKDTDRTFAGVLDQFAQDVEQGKRTPQSVQQAIERYQELAAEPFQATQTAPATHADPGQAPEVATPAVVAQSVQKAARNEDTKPSEMRKWLVGKIDDAIAVAPEAAVDFLSFDVPGDGTFKVQNSQARLQEFRKKVMTSPGFKDGGQKQNTKPLEQVDSAINGSGSTVEAIRNFLADGDVQSAIEFAKLKGVEFTPVEPRASMTANGKFKRMPASVKSSVPSVAEGLTQVEAEQINQYLTGQGSVFDAPEQATEDNYLETLFGAGASDQPSAPQGGASKRKIDANKIAPALRKLADQKQAEADDWAGRVYRNNTTQIDLRGDGPSRQDSMSTNSVNESRRRRAVEALTQQANAASKLADRVENGAIDLQARLDSISDTVDSDMRRDGGKPMIGSSRADMFEGYISSNLLGDDNYGHGQGTVARMLREAYEGQEQPAAQPITRADVTAAQQQAAAIITERIDAMTAGEVNTIARRFLPTMGVRPTVSKERNKAAVTDFTKVNPLAAAEEFGAALPADVRRVLQADMEGAVADGFVEQGGLAFSFAGARAATADKHALVTAQDRLSAGEDPETVRQETGWFKGTDGKWRFEINDADAKLRPALKSLEGGGYDAKQIASVTYRKREDGTYDVTLNPPSPKQTSDFVTLTGISKGAMRAVLPDSVVASVDRNEGDDDLIGDFEEAKRINVPFEFGGFNALPLDNVIDHPALFAAYPALRDVMVQVDPKLGIGGSFSYVDHNDGTTSKVIRLGSARQLSTLLHEIQHGIQDIEGFASGGSPNEFRDESADAEMLRDGAILAVMMRSQGTIEKAKALFVQRFKREPAFGSESAALSGESPESMRARADNALAPHERYRRLAGEVEARNTQARQGMTDEQRRATPPSQTADVADSRVIVMFNGKEMANAPMPANAAPDAATTAQPLRTPAATIRAAITKAYGKLLGQLEAKGLVTLTQTEDEAIEAAAQARAAKTGQSVEQARSTLRASVKNSVADQTQTENFQRWFKDSKVVDANGRPLVVYHGTHSSFTEFKPNDALGGGMFFSPSPEEAGAFTGATGSNIMPVYLSAQKVWPKIVRSYDEVKAIRAAKSKGYDAIRVRDDQNGVVNWVVFDPTQVKSATGNNGDFDPANPDIRRSADGSIQGFFDPQTGQSFLIADNLTAEAAPGVLMHEVGIHMAADGSMKALFNRAAMMLKLQRGNPFMKAVQDRMDAAGETSGEEAAAYIAEAYENDRANAPASVQRWLADLLAAVKAWMFKKGIMGADRLTVADIAAVARANARSMARDGGATGGQGFGTAFSRAPAGDQTQTEAFKRWFGASQVVDADGKPLVVYHGTNVGINEFKPAKGLRSAGGLFESSATSPFKFFSPDKEEAQSYANAKGGHRLFSVYLRMERPLDSTTPDGLVRMHRLFGSLDDTELSDWADSAVDLLDGIDELRATTPAEKSYFIKRDAKGRVIGQRATEREGYILEKYTAEDHAAEIERDLAQLIVEYEALLSAMPSSDAPLSVWAALDEPDSGDRLRAAGFDGLVFHENDGKKTFAVLDSTQIKSAVGNNGSFDPANPDIRFSRTTAQSIASSMGDMTPDQEKAYKNVAGVKAVPTVRERMDALKSNLGLKLRQGLVDQFAAIKQLDQNAYVQARMSKGTDGTLEAILMYGKPFMRDGAPDVDVKDGGFAKVLASLKGEQDRWMMWIAAQRAEKLKAEGKENLMTDDDISALKTLHAGKMADGTARMPIYAKALAELNEYNDAMLKLAMESGLIDQAAYDLMAGQPYVPFYRLMEDGDMKGPKFSSGLTNQKAWQKLKGGTQQLNADLLQNMLLNWSHLLQASAKNRAATATMDAAEKMAVAYKVDADTKGSVKVMRDGSAEHWMVEDPYLLDAISAIHYVPSPLMKPLAKFKQLLTWGVTVNPTFKIRNLIRDSVSAIAQSELGYNPAANVAKGWKLTAKDSQIYASMLASGGLIKFGTQENTDRLRAQVAKLGGVVLDKSGAERFFGQIKDLYDVYNEFGDRAENVNRAALYDALIKKGKTHAEAAFMARDLMDFSMGGSAPVVRFLTQTVPFLNARLVGLDKLGRAAMEDPRRFAAVTGAVALASLALMAGYSDDEDWKKREDWDRDAYWWFKIGGQAYRIPKPFEVGAIGTLAERTAELMLSDEMTGKRYMERVSHMLSGTFSFNPVPQAFKPLLDLYANKDSFTGRAIESQADQRLRPQDRYSERTPEVAKFLGGLGLPDPAQLVKGEYSALSPKQVEHLVRGYFSWVGTAAMTVSDFGLRPLAGRGERPDMRLKDVFIAGNFVENLPTGSSRYVTQMYEQSRQVEQAYASYQEAIKAGDMEKAQSIKESAGPLLRNRPAYTAATRQLAEINRTAKRIEADRDMAGAAKRARLTELEQQRQVIAQRVSRLAAATP